MKINMDNGRLLKFLLSGGTAALSEYMGYLVLLQSFGVIASHVVSFSIGLIVSFSLNKQWVFKAKGGGSTQFVKYLTLALTNLAVSSLILSFLVDMVAIHELISKLIVMVLIATWNYVIFSKLIFNNKSFK